MVREVRDQVDFPQCTPKEFFDVIFADDVSAKIYHKLNSSDDGATVTPWENNTRTVEFYKELNLPGPLASLIRSNKIRIREVQSLERENESEFSISSSPEFQLGMGSVLESTTRLTARAKNGGSELSILITCSASGPWGMTGIIESFMAEEAKTGVQTFLTFCETRIAESKLDVPSSISEAVDEDDEDLSFHDVHYETLSQCSFAENTALERRDSSGMLTTEALILKHVKRLEGELNLTTQAMESVMKRMESMEATLRENRRLTVLTVMGCSAVSFVCLCSLVAMKRHSGS